MRESDYGLDLLGTIVATQLKAVDFSVFNVTDALEVIKADIMEEIRRANRGCSAENLVFYFSYCTGELTVIEYVGKSYDPIDHHIKEFVVTLADLKILLDELQNVQNPEHEFY